MKASGHSDPQYGQLVVGSLEEITSRVMLRLSHRCRESPVPSQERRWDGLVRVWRISSRPRRPVLQRKSGGHPVVTCRENR